MSKHNLIVIGERINPGFASSNALFENEDIEGIQALAKRQAEAGAKYLNVNIGNRAVDDHKFMEEVVVAIQNAVNIPLSFDFPRLDVQEICLKVYDSAKANGEKPIINSVSETRMDMLEALNIQPCKIVAMASERVEDGESLANTKADQVHAVAKRMAKLLRTDYGMSNDDIFVDVSISTLASDSKGGTYMALGGIELIGKDPELAGIHMMGGLTNIGLMLPKKEYDGVALQSAIERAFLTIVCPLGFDTVLATPWDNHESLPEGHPVLVLLKELVKLQGVDFLRHLRKFYHA
jgi:5-methyltetrahydrofolate--homocysteine methyltransferase